MTAVNESEYTPAPIRDVLASRGVSVAALARATGIPRTTLRRRVNDMWGSTPGELIRIAHALSVKPAKLLNLSGIA